jgi:hypothetical protein
MTSTKLLQRLNLISKSSIVIVSMTGAILLIAVPLIISHSSYGSNNFFGFVVSLKVDCAQGVINCPLSSDYTIEVACTSGVLCDADPERFKGECCGSEGTFVNVNIGSQFNIQVVDGPSADISYSDVCGGTNTHAGPPPPICTITAKVS